MTKEAVHHGNTLCPGQAPPPLHGGPGNGPAEYPDHHRLSDDWYDVVVFRYLLTVQNWMERPELHRYAFSTIAWRAMSSAVSNERRKRQRRIQTVSLDAPVPDTDGVTIGDTITADNLCYVPYQG